MTERSVVVRLRGEITDLKTKMREGASAVEGVGAAARKTADQGKVAFSSLAKSIDNNSASIDHLSGNALKLGAGLAVGVGAVVKVAADFDKQMSSVAATGADARQNIDALRETAIKLGADSAFSATQAAEGVENLLKAGVDAAEVMGGGLKGSLDLAAAGSLDVGQAAEIAATALVQFKLQGKDVPHVADLLAAGAGKAQGEVGDLAAALNQSGLVASQFGLSIEDTTGTLAAFASAGLLGSDAGTSFKTMLLALANPSKESRKLMQELGIAAYDAQGNFVGVASLAEQLKERLGPLSQATRDQALAQIFGNDAVRAANVLFKEGGAGIQQWTADVDDAGFAAATARTKLDNLSGDVEALGGAIESTFITSGSGANEALRNLTQEATGLVRAVGSLPTPLLETSVKVAGVGAAGLITAGGIGKLAVSTLETRKAFAGLAETSPRLAGGLKAASTGAVALTGALIALQLAGQATNELFEDAPKTLGDAGQALAGLAKNTKDASTGMDEFFSLSTRADLGFGTEQVDSLGSAMNRLFHQSGPQKVGDWASGLISNFDGVKGSAQVIEERFGQLDQTLNTFVASGAGDKAAAAFQALRKEAELQRVPLDALLTKFPLYKASLQEQATALGVTALSAKDYADWMGGNVPPAIASAAEATDDATVKITGLGTSAGETAEELQELIDKFTILRDGALDQERANLAWEESLDAVAEATGAATKSTKDNNFSLDESTKRGRENRGALSAMVEELNNKITSDVKATGSTEGVSKKLKEGRERLLDSAEAAGLNRKSVEKMIDQMLLTPKELETKVSAPNVGKVTEDVAHLGTKIKGVNGRDVYIRAHFNTNADSVVADIKKTFSINGGPKFSAYALGGVMPGWSPGRDIHRFVSQTGGVLDLSGYESVMRPEWTAAVGEGRVNAWNEAARVGGVEGVRSAMSDYLGGFARGGTIRRNITIHGDPGAQPDRLTGPPDAGSYSLGIRGEDMMQALAKAVKAGVREMREEVGDFGRIDIGNPRGRTTFRGHSFTNLFAASLRAAEKGAGHNWQIYQGGWRPATSYSGTSHAGDAIDARVDMALLRAARGHGIAIWDRTGKGNWVAHMHGVPLPGAGYAAGSGVWQAQDYLRGGDGLWNGTDSAKAGVHGVAEKGFEVVTSPQLRLFSGGEQVLNNDTSKALLRTASAATGGGVQYHRHLTVGDTNLTGVLGDPELWLRKVQQRKSDAIAMAGLRRHS